MHCLSRPLFVLLSVMSSLRLAQSFAGGIPRAHAFRPLSTSVQSYLGEDSSKVFHSTTTTTTTTTRTAAARDSLAETSKTGEFQRRESAWRNWISRGTSVRSLSLRTVRLELGRLTVCCS